MKHYGLAVEDGWDGGLPCGGEIGVWVQADPHPGFAELARAGGRGAGGRLREAGGRIHALG